MKIVLIQLVLIVVVVLIAAFAVWSILFPSVWNQIAKIVGVGRGTDMVLYALVVAFLSFTLTTYVRFREFEARYTKLARRLALDEAGPPRAAARAAEQGEEPYAG